MYKGSALCINNKSYNVLLHNKNIIFDKTTCIMLFNTYVNVINDNL